MYEWEEHILLSLVLQQPQTGCAIRSEHLPEQEHSEPFSEFTFLFFFLLFPPVRVFWEGDWSFREDWHRVQGGNLAGASHRDRGILLALLWALVAFGSVALQRVVVCIPLLSYSKIARKRNV